MKFNRIVSLIVLLALSPALTADEKAYEVRIHRPDKKGQVLDVAAASAVRFYQKMTVGGREQEPAERLLAVELRGRVEIDEVNERGDALKVTWTVEKCTRLAGADGKEEELLPKGAVLIAEAGGEDTKLTLKNGKLTPDKEYALSLVASLAAPDSATSDELYGTKMKQKIGATWNVNAKTMAADAKRRKRDMSPDDVSGSVTLKGVKAIEGIEYLEVEGKVAVAKFSLTDPERKTLPPGMKSDGVSTETAFTALVPTDVNLSHVRFSRQDTWKETASGKLGRREQDATQETLVESTFDIRVVPISE